MIIKKCRKVNFQHVIEYFFVNFDVFLRIFQHKKNGPTNQDYPTLALSA